MGYWHQGGADGVCYARGPCQAAAKGHVLARGEGYAVRRESTEPRAARS